MTEQNGIDILCDAAGSDMLLSSFFSLGTPVGTPAAAPASTQPVVKRVKLTNDTSPSSTGAPSNSSNVCYICRRVYERADHLTRHMRSHENARPYACTRCPKRFNRADLLTRHEATHDRDTDGKTRTFIRRSDRAAEACLNCAAAKAKCDDQKPCGRCRTKNLSCQAGARRSSTYKTVADEQSAISPSDASSMASDSRGGNVYRLPDGAPYGHDRNTANNFDVNVGSALAEAPYMNSNEFQPGVLLDGISDDMAYFNPVHTYFQDMDFTSFDLNFDAFVIPAMDATVLSPQSTSINSSKTSGRNAVRDASRRHAAFRRSPWLWEPESKDYVSREKQGLQLNEESINSAAAFEKLVDTPTRWPKLSHATRDKLFAMIVSEHKDPSRVPSFPSLELLNYLLQADLAHGDHMCDDFFHAPTFNPEDTLTELLASVIASGATFISVPAIWQFGYAMQEIVRQRMERIFESKNSNTRNLKCLQTFILQLDIGIWSGFKRKTELAESFLQPIVTMVRRAGVLSTAGEPLSLVPTASDSLGVLEVKWHKFIHRESYKRLALHIFIHDVQASVSLQKNPLMSFTELAFSLPAARDMWKAPTAKAWRETWLRKTPLDPNTNVPRVADLMHRLRAADELGEYVDMELCYTAVLYGFWGQISAHREAVRFYGDRKEHGRESSHRLWLKTQHQELYRDVVEFAALLYSSRGNVAHLTLIAELFMMILHVSLDDLQRFAGKLGEEEARRASGALEEGWVNSAEARYAVWHAGQVLSSARRLAPTSLRRFNAMAVYFAGLTLWTYGMLSTAKNGAGSDPNGGDHVVKDNQREGHPDPTSFVVVDGEETRETRAFLQLCRGTPALSHNGDPADVEPLSNPSNVLMIARSVFRDNFPVRNEPLPPLVESLENLLRDLGSGTAGRPSRAVSEEGG
ncbi:hypothetical protein CONLIGDRAFT_660800 [Coniochaeta ligniaria NRRL 30616]|uniref:C6 transcription factor n=1 Tax=Coniochaeta ligniaria NRRL 30616 TaxID=1408157 RepID=A0A1J7JSW7_9PEZI|nr:hypothetical protein CONLIGDRAFT_660800 [Coniochaeta ligniaria NRRL 30616]